MANTKITTGNIADGAITSAKLDTSSLAIPSTATATTQTAGDNSTAIATTAYVETAVSNLVDSSPAALDTLNELAAALGDDANFSTTVTNSLALKAPLANPSFTGNVGIGTSNPNGLISISSGAGTKATIETTRNFTVNRNFQIAVDEYAEGTFTITPSTTLGGSSYTTPIFTATAPGNIGIGTSSPTVPLSIRKAHAASYGSGVDMLDFKAYYPGYDTETSKASIFAGTSDKHTLNTHGGYLAFKVNQSGFAGTAGSTNLAEAMRIEKDGNVGIGTSSFNATYNPRLQVTSAANDGTGGILIENYLPTLTLQDISGGAATSQIQQDQTNMLFKNNGSESMRIDSSGNLSVGGADSNDASLSLTADTGNWVFTNVRSSRNLEISDSDGTGTVLTIDTSGNVGIGGGPAGPLSLHVNVTTSGIGWTNGFFIKNDVNTSGTHKGIIFGDSSDSFQASISGESSGGLGQDLVFVTRASGSSIGERMRITNSGNVGIGGNPAEKLHVVGVARIQVPGNTSYYSNRTYLGDTYNYATNETADNVTFTIAGGNFSTSSSGGDFIFSTNMANATPTEKVRIRRDGILIHKPTHIGSLQNGDVGTYVGASGLSGTQRYTFYTVSDNTWRVVLNDMRDTSGFMYVTLGDAASKDTASYTYNITSVPYGVSMFGNLTYTDGGWNTGIFEFRITGNSPSYNLEVRFSSYYSSSNTATGYLMFERLY